MLDTNKARNRFKLSFDNSQEKLRNYRRARRDFVAEIVGRFWADRKTAVAGRKPLRLMYHAVETYVRALVARNPRVSITTEFPRLRPLAADGEVVMNAAIERFGLERHLTRWLRSAMVGFGILQVGLEADGFYQDPMTGEYIPKGSLYVGNVSLDDWVHDVGARSLDLCEYYGHQFLEPLDEARENPRYGKRARAELSASKSSNDTTSTGTERTSALGTRGAERSQDHVKLWQFYFPADQCICIMPENFTEDTKPLAIEDWNGPERGPYHFAFFTEVEDSTLPIPPAAIVMDLCQIADEVFRKEAENAENAKTILAFREGHQSDAKKVTTANNLDSVALESVDAVRELRLNGPRQEQLAFLAQAMTLFNMMSGNVNLIAGLGTKSPTLGQDQLLAEASNQQLGAMRDQVYKQVDGVLEHWAFYYWNDPLRIDQTIRQVPNTDIFVPVMLTPDQRRNEWARLNFTIEPYSLQRLTPQQRLLELDRLVANVVIPTLPILQQQGYVFDIAAYLRLKAKYSNMPEFLDLVKPMQGDWQRGNEMGERPRTTSAKFPAGGAGFGGGARRYEHVSTRAGEGDVGEELAAAAARMPPTPQVA